MHHSLNHEYERVKNQRVGRYDWTFIDGCDIAGFRFTMGFCYMCCIRRCSTSDYHPGCRKKTGCLIVTFHLLFPFPFFIFFVIFFSGQHGRNKIKEGLTILPLLWKQYLFQNSIRLWRVVSLKSRQK